MNTKPIRQISYLDDAVRLCPCGQAFTLDGDNHSDLKEWMDEHKEHSNGYLQHAVGDDWHRICASRPEDTMTKIK